jgi:hypothetical protein
MLKSGGRLVESRTVKPDASGRWLYAFADLPKFGPDGKTPEAYTVEEAPLDGWDASYDGYNIKNTRSKNSGSGHKPKPNPGGGAGAGARKSIHDRLEPEPGGGTADAGAAKGAGSGRSPKTSDESSPGLWTALLAASGTGLALLLSPLRRRKRTGS